MRLKEVFLEEVKDLSGYIQVAAYDLDGSVLAVDIIDSSGKKYLVADNPKGESLLRQIGKNVVASGQVSYETYGRLIAIESFQVK